MNCDVTGCEEIVTDEAMRLHRVITNLDAPRSRAWRDLYGDAVAPCGGHILNGLTYMNAVVFQGDADGQAAAVSNAPDSTEAAQEA